MDVCPSISVTISNFCSPELLSVGVVLLEAEVLLDTGMTPEEADMAESEVSVEAVG